jgi:hypothetical protein
MNKYISIVIILVIQFGFFVCCKKKETERPDNSLQVTSNTYPFFDVEWELIDGKLYIENLDNKSKIYYDHFNDVQTTTTLSPVNGSVVPLDDIAQDITNWLFKTSSFTLNSNNSYQLEYTTTTNNIVTARIYGLENGSARIVQQYLTDSVKLVVKTHEAVGSLGNTNVSFYSFLTFKKKGETCNNCIGNYNHSYEYGGVMPSRANYDNGLVGTKWVLTQYYDGFANVYPKDTLHFINNYQYTINNGTMLRYSLSNIVGNNNSDFTLYGLTTIGGDFSAQVPSSFTSTGELNSVKFKDVWKVQNDKTVWLEKI